MTWIPCAVCGEAIEVAPVGRKPRTCPAPEGRAVSRCRTLYARQMRSNRWRRVRAVRLLVELEKLVDELEAHVYLKRVRGDILRSSHEPTPAQLRALRAELEAERAGVEA